MMQKLLKLLSILLTYPEQALIDALPDLRQALATQSQLTAGLQLGLAGLIDHLAARDLIDAQEDYVLQFDRSRRLSLHLFEHVHGESRDRGQAMVDLAQMYEDNGFVIGAKELPDYLPLFLEYLSTQAQGDARALLGQITHIVTAIGEKLGQRHSPYQAVFETLARLAETGPDAQLLDALMQAEDDDPNDLQALDRIWEEEAVTFGGNAGEQSCGPDRLRTQMRAARRQPDAAASALPA